MCFSDFSEEDVDWGVASVASDDRDDQDQDEDECNSAEEYVDKHCECTKKTEHSQIKAISGISGIVNSVNSANAEATKSKKPTVVLKSSEMVDLEKRFSAMVDRVSRVSSEVRFWKIWKFWMMKHKLTHAKNTKRSLEIHRSTLRARKRRKSKRDQRSCW